MGGGRGVGGAGMWAGRWAGWGGVSQVMRDPVVASDGHVYERAAIQRCIAAGAARSFPSPPPHAHPPKPPPPKPHPPPSHHPTPPNPVLALLCLALVHVRLAGTVLFI